MKNHFYDLTIFDLVFVLKWNSGKWSVSLYFLIICLDNFLLNLIISQKNSSIIRIPNANSQKMRKIEKGATFLLSH